MKTLLLMRHAKAKVQGQGMTDRERPLSKRGHRDAPRMAALLERHGLEVDWILSSPALRAVETAKAVANELGADGEIHLVADLYGGEVADYLRAVANVPVHAGCALLVAHNPTLVEFLADLTGRTEDLPTGAVARIELPVEYWAEVLGWPEGRLMATWRPRELQPSS